MKMIPYFRFLGLSLVLLASSVLGQAVPPSISSWSTGGNGQWFNNLSNWSNGPVTGVGSVAWLNPILSGNPTIADVVLTPNAPTTTTATTFTLTGVPTNNSLSVADPNLGFTWTQSKGSSSTGFIVTYVPGSSSVTVQYTSANTSTRLLTISYALPVGGSVIDLVAYTDGTTTVFSKVLSASPVLGSGFGVQDSVYSWVSDGTVTGGKANGQSFFNGDPTSAFVVSYTIATRQLVVTYTSAGITETGGVSRPITATYSTSAPLGITLGTLGIGTQSGSNTVNLRLNSLTLNNNGAMAEINKIIGSASDEIASGLHLVNPLGLDVRTGGDFTSSLRLSGNIDGPSGLVKMDSGSATLTGNNTYTGPTIIRDTGGTVYLRSGITLFNCVTTTGSPVVNLTNGSTTKGLEVGMSINGTAVATSNFIQPGAVVTAVSSTQFTMNLPATGAAGSQTLTAKSTSGVTLAGCMAVAGSNSVNVTGAGGVAGLAVGMSLSGTSMPTSAVVTAIVDATHFTMNNVASATSSAAGESIIATSQLRLNLTQTLTGASTTSGGALVTLTGGSTTAGLVAQTLNQGVLQYQGSLVTGTGIPAGAWVAVVNTATTFTLNVNATATATGSTLKIGSATTATSPIIACANTTGLVAGMTITGANIPSGAVVTQVNPGGTTFVINTAPSVSSAGATFLAQAPLGLPIVNCSMDPGAGVPLISCNTKGGSASVTTGSTTGLAVGMYLTGPNLPVSAVIQTINSVTNTLTLSNKATGTGTGLTFIATTVPSFNLSLTLTGGSTTQGSQSITCDSTAGLVPGAQISGPNIPAGATILSPITSSISFNISAAATSTGTQLGFVVGGTTTAGSTTIYCADTTPLAVGMALSGPNVPNGATIATLPGSPGTSFTISTPVLSAVTGLALVAQNTANIDTITCNSTPNLAVGMAVNGPNMPSGAYITSVSGNPATSFTINTEPLRAGTGLMLFATTGGDVTLTSAATTNGSATVTCTSTLGLVLGMVVTGPNIPSGATVHGITNATTFVMSLPATGTATGQTLAGGTNAVSSSQIYLGTANRDGSTTVVMQLAASNQINDSAVIYFDSASSRNAYLRMEGFNETIAGISNDDSNGVIENTESENGVYKNAVLTINNSNDFSYSGYFRDRSSGNSTGTMGLNKGGTGTLSFSGTNVNFTGDSTVIAGNLRLQATSNWASNISVKSAATVELYAPSADWTFAASIVGAGGVIKTGPNMVTLGQDESYSGPTTITGGGTVQLAGVAYKQTVTTTSATTYTITLSRFPAPGSMFITDGPTAPGTVPVASTLSEPSGGFSSTSFSGTPGGSGAISGAEYNPATKVLTIKYGSAPASGMTLGVSYRQADSQRIGNTDGVDGTFSATLISVPNGTSLLVTDGADTWYQSSGGGSSVNGTFGVVYNSSNRLITVTYGTTPAFGKAISAVWEADEGLTSTSAINLNNGTLTILNNSARQFGPQLNTSNRVNALAPINSTAGTINFNTGGTDTFTQSMGALNLITGLTTISATGSQGGSSSLIFNSLVRASGAGSSITFVGNRAGADTSNNILFSQTPTLVGTNGLIGGWATVQDGSNFDFAQYGTTHGVEALTINRGSRTIGVGSWISSTDAMISGTSPTLGKATTVDSLIFNDATARTLALVNFTLTVNSGGIIFEGSNSHVISSSGAGKITGSTIVNTVNGNQVTQTGNELDLWTTAAAMSVVSTATLVNGTAGTNTPNQGMVVVKNGLGEVKMTAGNTYTGGTDVYGGDLDISQIACLGLLPGGNQFKANFLTLNNGTIQLSAGVQTNGSPTSPTITFDQNHGIVLGPAGGLFALDPTSTIIIQAPVSGPGGLTVGSKTIFSSGGVINLSGNNTFQGQVVATSGVISFNGGTNTFTGGYSTGTSGTIIVHNGASVPVNQPLVMAGGNFLVGSNTSIGALSGSTGVIGLQPDPAQGAATDNTTVLNANQPVLLTINQATNTTFTGTITDNQLSGAILGIEKTGPGVLTLSVTLGSDLSTYRGMTKISQGVLATTLLGTRSSSLGSGIGTGDGNLDRSVGSASLLYIENGAALSYVGSTATYTNRPFTIGVGALGAGIYANASGLGNTVNWSQGRLFTTDPTTFATIDKGADLIAFNKPNEAATLVLGGTNTGDNFFSMELHDNGSAPLSLQKSGAGTWVLGQALGANVTLTHCVVGIIPAGLSGTYTASQAPFIVSCDSIAGLVVGMPVYGPGLTPGTTVAVIDAVNSVFLLSIPCASVTPVGQTVTLQGVGTNATLTHCTVGVIPAALASIYVASQAPFIVTCDSTAALVPGMVVTGPGIAPGTTVSEVDAEVVPVFLLSQPCLTATGAGVTVTLQAIGDSPSNFSGGTVVYAGTLAIEQNGVLGSGGAPLQLLGGNLDFRNVVYTNKQTLAMDGGRVRSIIGSSSWAGNSTLDVPTTIEVDVGSSLDLKGAMSGQGTLTTAGIGTLTLEGNNSFTGATSIAEGTLELNYSTNPGSKLADGAALTLGGGRQGATVVMVGGPQGNEETVKNVVLALGQNRIIGVANGTALRMNSITIGQGATLDVQSFTASTSSANIDTPNETGSGILGPWATVNLSDWARNFTNGNDGAIVAFNGYSTDTWGGVTSNVNVTTSTTQTNASANTLRFGTNSGITLTLAGSNTLNDGGILQAPSAGAVNNIITGGTILLGNNAQGGNMVIQQNDTLGGLQINSAIANAPDLTTLSATYSSAVTNRIALSVVNIPSLNTANFYVGMGVSGPNIRPGSTVNGFSGNIYTITQNVASPLTFTAGPGGTPAAPPYTYQVSTAPSGALNEVVLPSAPTVPLVVGELVTDSNGLIPPNTVVATVVSSTDYILSNNLTGVASGDTLTGTMWGELALSGNVFTTTVLTGGVQAYQVHLSVGNTTGIVAGQGVSALGIPVGATVAGLVPGSTTDFYFTFSQTRNLTINGNPSYTGNIGVPTASVGGTQIHLLNGATTAGLAVGQPVTGPDIQPGSTIATIIPGSPSTDFTMNLSIFAPVVNITVSGRNGLLKTGAGDAQLGGVNTFTGPVTITGGTLSVTQVTNGGVPGTLGASTSLASNITIGGATLQYTGDSATVDRGFTINAQGAIDVANKGVTLNFTGNLSGGVAAGLGTLQKVGSGTLRLSRSVTLGGATNFGGFEVDGGTLQLAYNDPNDPAASTTVGVSDKFAAAANLATVTLAGGKLELIGVPNTPVVSGTDTIEDRTQDLQGQLTLNTGASEIKVTGGLNSNTTLNLQNTAAPTDVIRQPGGTVLFVANTNGATSVNIILGASSDEQAVPLTWATYKSTAPGSLPGVNDFAAIEPLNSAVVSADSKRLYDTTSNVADWSSGQTESESGTAFSGFTPSAQEIYAMRFYAQANGVVNITDSLLLAGGAILAATNSGNYSKVIQGGVITSGLSDVGTPTNDFIIHNYNPASPLQISSQIEDNPFGATPVPVNLVITGTGTTLLNGSNSPTIVVGAGTVPNPYYLANSYTGTTYVTGGVLRLGNPGALPGGIAFSPTPVKGSSNLTLKGGVLGISSSFTRGLGTGINQVQFTGSGGFAAYVSDSTVTFGASASTPLIWGAGSFVPDSSELLLSSSDATNKITIANPINLGGFARVVDVADGAAAVDATLSGGLSGNGGSLRKTGQGTLQLTGGQGTQTGGAVLGEGTLITSASSLGTGPLGIGSTDNTNSIDSLVLELRGGSFSSPITVGNKNSQGITTISASSSPILNGPMTLSRQIFFGPQQGRKITMNGGISGTGGFTVIGGGVVALNGAGSFPGAPGTAGTTQGPAVDGAVTVRNGALYLGNSTALGNANVELGDTATTVSFSVDRTTAGRSVLLQGGTYNASSSGRPGTNNGLGGFIFQGQSTLVIDGRTYTQADTLDGVPFHKRTLILVDGETESPDRNGIFELVYAFGDTATIDGCETTLITTLLPNTTSYRGSNSVTTAVGGTAGLVAGMKVTNPNFPAGTVITSIVDDHTFLVNQVASGYATGNLGSIQLTIGSKTIVCGDTSQLAAGMPISSSDTTIPANAVIDSVLSDGVTFTINLPVTAAVSNDTFTVRFGDSIGMNRISEFDQESQMKYGTRVFVKDDGTGATDAGKTFFLAADVQVTFGSVTLTNGATTINSNVVTCADTTGLSIGMQVADSGTDPSLNIDLVPFATITGVVNSTTFLVNTASQHTGTGLTLTAILVPPVPQFSPTWWEVETLNPNVSMLATTSGLAIGNSIDINAPVGTGVTSIGGAPSLSSGMTSFNGNVVLQNAPRLLTNCVTSAGSGFITCDSTGSLLVGMSITGPNMPANATVVSIASSSQAPTYVVTMQADTVKNKIRVTGGSLVPLVLGESVSDSSGFIPQGTVVSQVLNATDYLLSNNLLNAGTGITVTAQSSVASFVIDPPATASTANNAPVTLTATTNRTVQLLSDTLGGVVFNGVFSEANSSGDTLGLQKLGTGSVTLSGANTYKGGTNVLSGTLLVNNTIGSGTGTGPVNVSNVGTVLGGNNGLISGLTTLSNGAVLMPGDPSSGGIGTLNFGSGLTLGQGVSVNLALNGGASYDQVVVGGKLTVDPSVVFNLLLNFPLNSSITGDIDFQLLQWGSLSASGTLANQLDLPSLVGNGFFWDTSKFNTTGVVSLDPRGANSTPEARFAVNAAQVIEGEFSVKVAVELDIPAPAGGIQIPLVTGGTATAGPAADYELPSPTVFFAQGQSSVDVTILVHNNPVAQPTVTAVLSLGSATQGTVLTGSPAAFTLSIVNNHGSIPLGGRWALRNPLPTNETLLGVTQLASTLVAVGTSGALLESTDGGTTWTTVKLGINPTFHGVAASPSLPLFVAVGDGGNIVTSPDGLTWTYRNASGDKMLQSVIWADALSLFVAVGEEGLVYTSPDGATWTYQANTNTAADLEAVAWNGSTLVAVGQSGAIITATDPTGTWNQATSGTGAMLRSVTYFSNTFVAVGDGGALVTSPDGTNWTAWAAGSVTAANPNLLAVFADGSHFIAAGAGGVLFTSSTGLGGSWTASPSGVTTALQAGVATGTGSSLLVGASGVVLKGTGTTFTKSAASVGATDAFQAVTYNSTLNEFIAVGQNGRIATSVATTTPVAPAGNTWTVVQPSITSQRLASIASNGGQLVVVGDGGTVLTSSPGVSWRSVTSGVSVNLRNVTYAAGAYYAVGELGTILTSTSGTSWSQLTSPTTTNLQGIASSGSLWVAVGDVGTNSGTGAVGGTILISSDGVNWEDDSPGGLPGLTGVTWTGTQFIITGATGTLITTPDGINLAQQTSFTTETLSGAVWTGTGGFVVGAQGTVLGSPDGITWSVLSSGTLQDLNAIACNNTSTGPRLAAVGASGTILTSDPVVTPAPTVQFATTSMTVDDLIGTVNVPITINRIPSTDLHVSFTLANLPAAYYTAPVLPLVIKASSITAAEATAGTFTRYLPIKLTSNAIKTTAQQMVVTMTALGATDNGRIIAPTVFTLNITVAVKPGISLPVEHQMVAVGAPVSLTAIVTGSTSTVQWLKNGVAVAGATGPAYNIAAATTANAGKYTAKATNILGTALSTASAEVSVVDESPHLILAKTGTSAVLTATAAGDGLTYAWFKAGTPATPITSTTNPAKYTVATSKLTVKTVSVGAGDDGNVFYCTVSQTTTPATGLTANTGNLTLYVAAQPDILAPASGNIPEGRVGASYSLQIPRTSVTGGNPGGDPHSAPAAYTATGLPTGLTINATTGLISGIPTVAGVFKSVKVTATNASGVPTVTPLFTITIDPIPPTALGTFVGLADRTGTSLTGTLGLGARFDLTTTANSAYTGKLTIGTSVYAFTGKLVTSAVADVVQHNPQGQVTIARTLGKSTLTVAFSIDPSATLVSGTVTDPTTSAGINGWRQTVPSPGVGDPTTLVGLHNFIADVPGGPPSDGSQPEGTSYGALTITTTGTTAVAGKAADGSALATSGVMGSTGQVLVYQSLYVTPGTFSGIITIDTGTAGLNEGYIQAATGTLTWSHPAQAATTNRTFRSGWPQPITLGVDGGKYYLASVANGPSIIMSLQDNTGSSDPTNAQLSFTGGNIAGTAVSPSLNDANGKMFQVKSLATPVIPANATSTTLTITNATGAFTGTFTLTDPDPRGGKNPPVVRKVTYQGLIIPNTATPLSILDGVGYGYFLLPQLPTITPPTTPTTSPILSGLTTFEAK